MSDLSVHVCKLGHELEEIRLRAFNNIISKLECGLLDEATLLDQDRVFVNLINWFYFDSVPEKVGVLRLILRLLQEKAGVNLLLRADHGLKQLNGIECGSNNVRLLLDKINRVVENEVERMREVCPRSLPPESEASPIILEIRESSSTLPQSPPPSRAASNVPPSSVRSVNESAIQDSCFCVWMLPWQQLARSDVHVLAAVENSLNNFSTADHSCLFFTDVMLHDFPVEVFLQRQGIVKCLLSLAEKNSPYAINALNEFVRLLENRLLFFFDPATSCLRLEIPAVTTLVSSDISSPLTTQRDSPLATDIRNQYQQEGYKDVNDTDKAVSSGSTDQLSVPQFCALLLKTVVPLCGRLEGVAAPLLPRLLRLLSSCMYNAHAFWSASDRHSLPIQHLLRTSMVKYAQAISLSMTLDPVERLLLVCSTCLFLRTIVPCSLAFSVVPEELQKVLTDLLLDPVIVVLYKELHQTILSYVHSFKKNGESRYIEIKSMHKAMLNALTFLRESNELSPEEAISVFRESLPCLVLHRRYELIDQFVLLCTERLIGKDSEKASEIILQMLAHVDVVVSSKTYAACHKTVSTLFGPDQAVTGVDPAPKLRFLLNSFVLKEIVCHGMTSEDNQVRQWAEEILLLILKCKILVSNSSWRNILTELTPVFPLLQGFADSDSPIGQAVTDMFNPDVAKTQDISDLQVFSANVRFLFSAVESCREEAAARLMWLVGIAVQDNSICDICLVERSISGKPRLGGIYEPGSMVRILDLLQSCDAHEYQSVHDAALVQLSVMIDDPHLHDIFLEQDGLGLVLHLLTSTGNMTGDVKRVLLPVISVLKNLTRHSSKIRLQLCQDLNILKAIVRGLFKFRGDWRLQRDATQLLAFLAFGEFYITTKSSISLPYIILTHFRLPFECVAHLKVSPHTQASEKGAMLTDKSCQTVLSVLWLVAESEEIMLIKQPPQQENPELTVSIQVLRRIQGSDVVHNCNKLLEAVQDARSHKEVFDILPKLTKFVEVCYMQSETKANIKSSPAWKKSFYKFISGFPNNDDDERLLHSVLLFLKFVAETLKPQMKWLSDVLNSPVHPMSKMLTSFPISVDSGLVMWKELCMGVLDLASLCVTNPGEITEGWNNLTMQILQCLHYTHNQHFYNLAFLGKALGSLSRLLSSGDADIEDLKCGVLWELLAAFHSGTPQSCMGLGITRQTILVLVNMLQLDMKIRKNGKWEKDWLKDDYLLSLPPLLQSKDIVVRAATFQLLNGLCLERHVFLVVLETLPSLWTTAISVFLDSNEASLVREQAILLCSCIVSHDKNELYLTSLEEHSFYHQMKIALNNLVLEQMVWDKHIFLLSEDVELENVSTTPGLIKSACWLLLALLSHFSFNVTRDVCESGVVQSLMRCLTKRSKSEMFLRDDIGEMFASVSSVLCYTLNKTVNIPSDVLQALFSLLSPDIYGEEHQKMRDKLWGKLLSLISAILVNSENDTVLPSSVVTTVCFCISETPNATLQQHALLSIPALASNLDCESCQSICESLMSVWEKCITSKRKEALIQGLTTLLGKSQEASLVALNLDLLSLLIYRLRTLLVTLTVETGDTSRLRKGNPILAELSLYLSLACNFLTGSPEVKIAAANVGFADILHKLWVWCLADRFMCVLSLKTLITFTADCPSGARSLVLTSTMSGVGQRKTPSAFSLVHALISLLTKDHYSLEVFGKACILLSHACQASEGRAIISKSNLLAKFTDLGRQKRSPTDDVEGVWLRFLSVYSFYPDGQVAVSKGREVLDQLMDYAVCEKLTIRTSALCVLRNIAFHSSNRPRLLSSDNFLKLLTDKLQSTICSVDEKIIVASIVWALAANNQKAKLCLRGAGIDSRIRLAAATLRSDHPAVELLDNIYSILVQAR